MKVPAICALLLSAALTACGGGEVPLVFPTVEVQEPPLDSGATLRGHVAWSAEVAPPRLRLVVPDRWCQGLGADFRSREVRVAEGGLADVLVHVVSGLETFRFDHRRDEALLDQSECLFEPYVLAVRTHQPVRFRNSDVIAHNVNTSGSKRGQGFVRTTAAQGSSTVAQFGTPEFSIPVGCDLHPWMQAFIHVLPHPYFTVTDARGNFRFPRPLPPGTYTLEALHPKLGAKRADFVVPPGAAGELEQGFAFP